MRVSLYYTAVLLLAAVSIPNKVSAFATRQPNNPKAVQSVQVEDAAPPHNSRRRVLQQFPFLFGLAITTTSLLLPAAPALAAAKEEPEALPTQQVVTAAFDAIRYELKDPQGGVAIMQERIDQQDWAGLMEFTRGYDLEMRKLRMGRAKKLLQSKDLQLTGTQFANAVTFDLIGMNRSSRAGQESVEGANKYLQEMRDDIAKFLELEKTIQVEG
jgi:hypothetical protein